MSKAPAALVFLWLVLWLAAAPAHAQDSPPPPPTPTPNPLETCFTEGLGKCLPDVARAYGGWIVMA